MFGAQAAIGAAMLTWTLAGSLPVALVLVFVTAIIEGPAIASGLTLRQQRTPPALLAQVLGTLTSFQIGMFAIGSAIGGPLVVAQGPQNCILIVGAAVFAAAVIAVGIRAALPERALRPSAR